MRLRSWTPADAEPLYALNTDPRVTEFLPPVTSREASDALILRFQQHFDEYGYGIWAVEVPNQASFIGFVGLSHVTFAAPFAPAVEIAWRLSPEHWGRGLATEAALGVLRIAFEPLDLDFVVSFTVPENVRSRRVMEKIGMVHNPRDDFEHPTLPEGHPLRRHVLYRLPRLRYFARIA